MKTRDITLEPLNRILQKYGEEVQEVVLSSLDKVADETVKELKDNSPRSDNGKKHYWKGWVKDKMNTTWHRVNIVIYNKNKPWLTHLLNSGYTRRNGKRVAGDMHIDMAEDYATDRLEEIAVEEISKL